MTFYKPLKIDGTKPANPDPSKPTCPVKKTMPR